ncbi:MAG: RsmG family class I SAM-dependent methyltransferase [Acidimicrobiales bacterium]
MTSQLVELLEESRRRGFLGPGPIEGHLDHARAFAVAVPDAPARALDLGAGGGLPGLVLAVVAWPEARWTFLDAQLRRTEFLVEAVDALDLGDRVEVVTERAEVVGRAPAHRSSYDLVVARSFGPPAVTLECAAPLLRAGGAFVGSEPPDGSLEARWPADGVARLGGAPAVAIEVPGAHLVRIVATAPCPDTYPRRVGVPSKRPMF